MVGIFFVYDPRIYADLSDRKSDLEPSKKGQVKQHLFIHGRAVIITVSDSAKPFYQGFAMPDYRWARVQCIDSSSEHFYNFLR